jgi:hypothetical protein
VIRQEREENDEEEAVFCKKRKYLMIYREGKPPCETSTPPTFPSPPPKMKKAIDVPEIQCLSDVGRRGGV